MAHSDKLLGIIHVALGKCEAYYTKKQYSFCISLNLGQKEQ